MSNETWIVDAGDAVIQKIGREGRAGLSSAERLIYCLWVADYGMRNAGDLRAARDVYADFQTEAAHLADELRLPATRAAFALPTVELERRYFALLHGICEEVDRLSRVQKC